MDNTAQDLVVHRSLVANCLVFPIQAIFEGPYYRHLLLFALFRIMPLQSTRDATILRRLQHLGSCAVVRRIRQWNQQRRVGLLEWRELKTKRQTLASLDSEPRRLRYLRLLTP